MVCSGKETEIYLVRLGRGICQIYIRIEKGIAALCVASGIIECKYWCYDGIEPASAYRHIV